MLLTLIQNEIIAPQLKFSQTKHVASNRTIIDFLNDQFILVIKALLLKGKRLVLKRKTNTDLPLASKKIVKILQTKKGNLKCQMAAQFALPSG